MFILKRQDVEITSVQHPKRDQQIPILQYQGQTFRLISIFNAVQEEEAKAAWRDLTDNRGKACVLLEEPERFSIWGKIHLDQLAAETVDPPIAGETSSSMVQASLLLLQAVYLDIEDLLGARQVGAFQREITAVFQQSGFPQTQSLQDIQHLLTADPLASLQLPLWREHHLNTLLQELHRLGREHFGNTNFTQRVMDALEDLPPKERSQFLTWLKQAPAGKLWH